MKIFEAFRIALRAIASNKLRSALTMLGMIIGVGAVITLMSVGQGVQQSIVSQVQALGTNLLFITPGATQQGGVRTAQGTGQSLTLEDAEAIAEPGAINNIVAVAPEMRSMGQIVANGQNAATSLIGVTPEYLEVRNFKLADGEFITSQEQDARSRVAVLGAMVAQNVFGEGSPVGQDIRINRANFRVVGVLQAKGSSSMGNQDDLILIPLSTLQAQFSRQMTARGGHAVSTINIQLTDSNSTTQAVEEIGILLRDRHKVAQDDFTIRSQQDMQQTFTQITDTLTLLLGSIAGISLVVGGIGIMNIMLVSVTERTREIGIRKAVGAKRYDILIQFLIEAVVVSLVGGGTGILCGVGISRLISGIQFNGQALQTIVSWDAVLMAFFVSAAIGIFFGIYPATRAAKLNPIDALRYE